MNKKGFWYWVRAAIASLVNAVLFFSFTLISMSLNGFLFFWFGEYVVFPVDINLTALSDVISFIKFTEVNLGTIVIVSLGLLLDIAKAVRPIMRNYLLSKGDVAGAIRAEGFGTKLTWLSILATTITFALVAENIAKSSNSSELETVTKQIVRQQEKIDGSLQDELTKWTSMDEKAEQEGKPRYTKKVSDAKKAIEAAKDELTKLENKKIDLEKNSLAVKTENKDEKKDTISQYLSNMFIAMIIGFIVARLLEAGVQHTGHALTVNHNEFVTLDETIKEFERQKKISWFVGAKNWFNNFFKHGLIIEGEATEIKKESVVLSNNNEIDLLVDKKLQEALASIAPPSTPQNNIDVSALKNELLLEISNLKNIVQMSAEPKIEQNIFVPCPDENDKNIENQMSAKNVCEPLSQQLADNLTDEKNDISQTKNITTNKVKKDVVADVLKVPDKEPQRQKPHVKVVKEVVIVRDKPKPETKKKYNKQTTINNFKPWTREQIKEGILNDIFPKLTARAVGEATHTCKNTARSVFVELCETGDMQQLENNRYIRIYKDKSVRSKPTLAVSNSGKLVKFDNYKMQSDNDEIHSELEEC